MMASCIFTEKKKEKAGCFLQRCRVTFLPSFWPSRAVLSAAVQACKGLLLGTVLVVWPQKTDTCPPTHRFTMHYLRRCSCFLTLTRPPHRPIYQLAHTKEVCKPPILNSCLSPDILSSAATTVLDVRECKRDRLTKTHAEAY